MALSWSVVGAVLFAALLHASWNALVKSSEDKSLDAALIHLIGSFISIPLLAWAGLPPQAAWPFIGASLLIHIAYYITLTAAYHHGDLGLTYPVMRGLGPIFVALFQAFCWPNRLAGLHGSVFSPFVLASCSWVYRLDRCSIRRRFDLLWPMRSSLHATSSSMPWVYVQPSTREAVPFSMSRCFLHLTVGLLPFSFFIAAASQSHGLMPAQDLRRPPVVRSPH